MKIKAAIWTNIQNHYQFAFFQALQQANVDLVVRYYDANHLKERLTQGWVPPPLQANEALVKPELSCLSSIPDYKERVHIIPGYGSRFLRQLALHLSREAVQWVHWSECSHPGLRWFLSYPRKRWYGGLVARHALGAFAQGAMAKKDFMRWGIPGERIAFLYYSPQVGDSSAEPSRECVALLAGRNAFLFLGAQCRRKGIDVLLKSFAAIPVNERSQWVLLVVGLDYSEGKYRAMADKLGLAGSVQFMKPIGSNQLATILKCAKVLVLPSRFDGWGVVVNEAASMGLAAIGTDRVGAAYHVIHPGTNGFMVRSGNVRSLRLALQAYTQNPGLASAHGESSLAISKEFTPGSNAQRFLRAIEGWRSMPLPTT